VSDDHLERLEKLLKDSPGILGEGLTPHEEADVRRTMAELKQLRDQLGEKGAEWAADGPGGWMQWPGPDGERFARGIVDTAAERGVDVKLMRRVVGEWKVAPE
jgi:hypothetical protein